ncbi:MBL fold metallo-hydrolase [Streptomyces sp. bgisy027]|uniref:MBL fold metallo-hydrolase n=1 Tax=Streptomyces sp. bgisy027 TaxID=3413770 RepID=UPI003D740B1F
MAVFTGAPRLEEIAEGVHAFLQPDGGWCLNNAGLVVDGGTALLIDTAATEARAGRLRELVAGTAPQLPRLLVNTHAHGDHTFGNHLFPEAVVVAAERTRQEAVRTGLHLTTLWPDVDWGAVEPAAPHVTFAEELTLHVGEQQVRLRAFGPAHSSCDTVAWLPERRVLFAGDLVMNGVTPFVLTGSVGGLRDAVARLRALDAVTVVPGHGPVGGPELLETTERYLAWLLDVAKAGLAGGADPSAAARAADLGEFAEYLDTERLVPNLYRAYGELRGGRPEDFAGIDEMVRGMAELHGGFPACHA